LENAFKQKEEAKNEFLAFETTSSDKIASLQQQNEQSSWSRFPFTSGKVEEEAQKVGHLQSRQLDKSAQNTVPAMLFSSGNSSSYVLGS
jgi:hypothetical protein